MMTMYHIALHWMASPNLISVGAGFVYSYTSVESVAKSL
jgi:hypothetical protein